MGGQMKTTFILFAVIAAAALSNSFRLEDPVFIGGGTDYGNTEYWFYHHAERPWDTSDFYAELWNGASSAPISQLNQTTVTAYHNSGVFAVSIGDVRKFIKLAGGILASEINIAPTDNKLQLSGQRA